MGSNPPIRAVPPQVADPNRHIAHFLNTIRPHALEHARYGQSYFARSRAGGDHLREEDWNLEYDPSRVSSTLASSTLASSSPSSYSGGLVGGRRAQPVPLPLHAAAATAAAQAWLHLSNAELRQLFINELRARKAKLAADIIGTSPSPTGTTGAAAPLATAATAPRLANARSSPYARQVSTAAAATTTTTTTPMATPRGAARGCGASDGRRVRIQQLQQQLQQLQQLHVAVVDVNGGASEAALAAHAMAPTSNNNNDTTTRPVTDNTRGGPVPAGAGAGAAPPLAHPLAFGDRFKSSAHLKVQLPRGIFARGVASQPVNVAAAKASSIDPELRFLGIVGGTDAEASLSASPQRNNPAAARHVVAAPDVIGTSEVPVLAAYPRATFGQPQVAALQQLQQQQQRQQQVPVGWTWSLQDDATTPALQPLPIDTATGSPTGAGVRDGMTVAGIFPSAPDPSLRMTTTTTTTAAVPAGQMTAPVTHSAAVAAGVATPWSNWPSTQALAAAATTQPTGTLHKPSQEWIGALGSWCNSNLVAAAAAAAGAHTAGDNGNRTASQHQQQLQSQPNLLPTIKRMNNWSARPVSAPPPPQNCITTSPPMYSDDIEMESPEVVVQCDNRDTPVIVPVEPEYDPPSFTHSAVDDTAFPERSSLQPTSPACLASPPEWPAPLLQQQQPQVAAWDAQPAVTGVMTDAFNYPFGVLDSTKPFDTAAAYPAPYSYGYQQPKPTLPDPTTTNINPIGMSLDDYIELSRMY